MAAVSSKNLSGSFPALLSTSEFETLAVVQRKMLRLIIGYVKKPDDTWEDMYRRLKQKIEAALHRFPIHDWVNELKKRKRKFQSNLRNGLRNPLTQYMHVWQPNDINDEKLEQRPRRLRGRPKTTWYDHVVSAESE